MRFGGRPIESGKVFSKLPNPLSHDVCRIPSSPKSPLPLSRQLKTNQPSEHRTENQQRASTDFLSPRSKKPHKTHTKGRDSRARHQDLESAPPVSKRQDKPNLFRIAVFRRSIASTNWSNKEDRTPTEKNTTNLLPRLLDPGLQDVAPGLILCPQSALAQRQQHGSPFNEV